MAPLLVALPLTRLPGVVQTDPSSVVTWIIYLLAIPTGIAGVVGASMASCCYAPNKDSDSD